MTLAAPPLIEIKSAKKMPTKISGVFIWLLLLFISLDVGARVFFHHDHHTPYEEKLGSFFNSNSNPELMLIGSSVALSSSYYADKSLGIIDDRVEKKNYLGLVHLSQKIEAATGKKFSAGNLSCYGATTSDAWMCVNKLVEFKKVPKVIIYETVSRDLFDASMPPLGTSPYYRYMMSIHPANDHSLIPAPLRKIFDDLSRSPICTTITLLIDDDQIIQSPERIRSAIDAIFCAICSIYDNRLAISAQINNVVSELTGRQKTLHSASLQNQIENKKKNPFAQLSAAGAGSYEVSEVPQNKRYEQEKVYFQKLLKLCKANKIQLIIVNMPAKAVYHQMVPPSLRKRCPAESYGLAKSYGYPVIDLDDTSIFTDDCFIDFGHLNTKGALKVNELLIDRISKENLLKEI